MPKFEKVVISSGSGPVASEHDRIIAEVSLSIDNVLKQDRTNIVFDLGHAEDFGVVKLLDAVVETMRLNERCVAKSSIFSGLTAFERQQLISDQSKDLNILLTVHLRDIQKLNKFWQMSESEKITVAKVMKYRGNKLLRSSQYVRAFRAYKHGVRLLQGSVSVLNAIDEQNNQDISGTSQQEARQLLMLCFANAALCLLQLMGHNTTQSESTRQIIYKCIKYCQSAIELDPSYAKSWFRLAKAHAALGEFDAAIEAGERCLKNVQGDASRMAEVSNLLEQWRLSAIEANKLEREAIRQAVVQKYQYTDEESDDEYEIDKLPISVWSNSLAADMMSLHEELEAFGEKMPEPKTSRSGRRLETIEDGENSDDFERD